MHFSIIFATTIILIKSASSELLNCDYLIFDEDGYNCKILNILSEPKEVTSVTENHKTGRNALSVQTIYASSQSETKYLPTNMCAHFPSVTKIDIYAKKLVEITKDIFEGCSKLETIYLRYLNITTFDDDLFSGVPSLQKVMVVDSKIQTLPKDFFKNNENLTFIKFDSCDLEVVDFELSQDQKNKLKTFSFLNNVCISKAFKSDDTRSPSLNSVIDEIATNCRNNSASTPQPLVESPNEQRIQILESKFEDLEELKKSLVEQIQDGVKKINDSLDTASIKLELIGDRLDYFTKYINGNLSMVLKNVKTNYENLNSNAIKIYEKSEEMMTQIRETLEIKTENQDLRSAIDYNGSMMIVIFVLQIITVTFAIMLTIYVKFFSNLDGKSNEIENVMYNNGRN